MKKVFFLLAFAAILQSCGTTKSTATSSSTPSTAAPVAEQKRVETPEEIAARKQRSADRKAKANARMQTAPAAAKSTEKLMINE